MKKIILFIVLLVLYCHSKEVSCFGVNGAKIHISNTFGKCVIVVNGQKYFKTIITNTFIFTNDDGKINTFASDSNNPNTNEAIENLCFTATQVFYNDDKFSCKEK